MTEMRLMTRGRRALGMLLVGALGLVAAACGEGETEAFPSETVTIIVDRAPGGTFDAVARALAGPLSEELGVDVIVENRPPPAVGVSVFNRSEPDGYTLLAFNPFDAIGALLDEDVDFDLREFSYIGNQASIALGVIVQADSPWHSLEDMQNADEPLRTGEWAGGVTERAIHSAELEKIGVPVQIVRGYEGFAPTYPDLLSGDLDFLMPPPTSGDALQYIESGDVRAIVTFHPDGDPVFDDLPSIQQLGHEDFPFIPNTYPIAAPPGLSEERQAILEDAMQAAMASDAYQAFLEEFGLVHSHDPRRGAETLELMEELFAINEAFRTN